jgi:hypothetical protein
VVSGEVVEWVISLDSIGEVLGESFSDSSSVVGKLSTLKRGLSNSGRSSKVFAMVID